MRTAWAIAVVGLLAGEAGAAPFGPFRSAGAPVTTDGRDPVVTSARLPTADPFWFAFRVYQETLSSTDGPRCNHSPTCSLYGVQAVRRHGAMGFFLTVDRLWRQGRSSELRPLPHDYRAGPTRLFDPVEANDFWLRGIPDDFQHELVPPRPRQ